MVDVHALANEVADESQGPQELADKVAEAVGAGDWDEVAEELSGTIFPALAAGHPGDLLIAAVELGRKIEQARSAE